MLRSMERCALVVSLLGCARLGPDAKITGAQAARSDRVLVQAKFPSNCLLDREAGRVRPPPLDALPAGLGAALATLDGFSTTGLVSATTSGPIRAGSVTPDTVLLYRLQDGSATRVPGTEYATEPTFLVVDGVTTAIGLQPATPYQPGSRALAEGTTYAVLVTKGVRDLQGRPLAQDEATRLLLHGNPHEGVQGGVPAGIDCDLDAMRAELLPAVRALEADTGLGKGEVVAAWTFRTQTFVQQALGLGALPYQRDDQGDDVFPAVPASLGGAPRLELLTAAEAFHRYGLDPGTVPSGAIDAVLETELITYDLLDPATGAFVPDPAMGHPEAIGATVVLPHATAVPACAGDEGTRCAPLLVFRHGINAARGEVLPVANAFAARGMVVVAIDAALHGERSFCARDDECAPGATCVPVPGLEHQGDAVTPGKCQGGGFAFKAVQENVCETGDDACKNACSVASGCWGGTGGIARASGEYLFGVNLFRTRDVFRQDVIDQSMLVRVMAPMGEVVPGTHALLEVLRPMGVTIDPTRVFFVGQSFGGMQGVVDVAVSPRVSKVALTPSGGTFVDVAFGSPRLEPLVDALLAALGIGRTDPEYLQLLTVATWILDPAESMNFAAFLKRSPLPDLLSGTPAQVPKPVVTVRSQCDSWIPDPFELLLYQAIGVDADTLFTADPAYTRFDACPAGRYPHAPLTAWGTSAALTQLAQDDVAAFFLEGTLPPPIRSP